MSDHEAVSTRLWIAHLSGSCHEYKDEQGWAIETAVQSSKVLLVKVTSALSYAETPSSTSIVGIEQMKLMQTHLSVRPEKVTCKRETIKPGAAGMEDKKKGRPECHSECRRVARPAESCRVGAHDSAHDARDGNGGGHGNIRLNHANTPIRSGAGGES